MIQGRWTQRVVLLLRLTEAQKHTLISVRSARVRRLRESVKKKTEWKLAESIAKTNEELKT